ncbi:unnamed protein product [Paramecium octaurelia]|uniref:Uncharacterized protein n=1 Tax=Paramecium octaurelia TaxID=43137 RepID=A0A8S1WWA6_PAROT|nr:unnamed protein product [Paramecium octaurelia]
MAFVYQAERNMLNKPSGAPPNVGPGSYLSHEQFRIKQGNAPFDTQVTRTQQLRQDNSPGPGSYNIFNEVQGQNIVLQSSQSDVKVVEKPQPQSVFASQTKRFHHPKTMLSPGPGTYDTNNSGTKVIQQQYTSQHYIETIMKLNKYQSIPSIPSSNQGYGYMEKGTHDLEVNKFPFPQFTGLKQDSVGPGQYDVKDAFEQNKYKGSFWHKSKAPRLAPTISKERELMVGPGTYDPNTSVVPLHKLNPSGNFQSKSQRMFDSTKEEKQKQFMKIFFDKQKDMIQKKGPNYIEDDEYVFCDDTTPGPGQYLGNTSNQSAISTNTQSQSTTKMGKNCFGSKSRRFQEKKMPCYVGPGDYELEKDFIKEAISSKQTPFQSTNLRFEAKGQEKRPGPQAYNPKITLEDKLIKKLERAPIGNFGSNQQRFKPQEDEVPGPGAYDQHKKEVKTIASVFTSKTKRGDAAPVSKDHFPAPGAYDVKNYTIEQMTKIEKEEDPDLAIYKPAFGSSIPRFMHKEKKPIDEVEEEQEDEQIRMHNSSSLFQKKKYPHPPFNIKENRFNYDKKKDDNQPGPGEYFDPKENGWNKSTFNILFQEI